jgi:hypothetical protein
MYEVRVHCPVCDARYDVLTDYKCPYCYRNYEHSEDLRYHIENCHTRKGKWEH